jgi:hypothetical protein
VPLNTSTHFENQLYGVPSELRNNPRVQTIIEVFRTAALSCMLMHSALYSYIVLDEFNVPLLQRGEEPSGVVFVLGLSLTACVSPAGAFFKSPRISCRSRRTSVSMCLSTWFVRNRSWLGPTEGRNLRDLFLCGKDRDFRNIRLVVIVSILRDDELSRVRAGGAQLWHTLMVEILEDCVPYAHCQIFLLLLMRLLYHSRNIT